LYKQRHQLQERVTEKKMDKLSWIAEAMSIYVTEPSSVYVLRQISSISRYFSVRRITSTRSVSRPTWPMCRQLS